MDNNYLYSFLLEMRVVKAGHIPTTNGHLAHALFLNLIDQADPALNKKLHNEPHYRPFTVSSVIGLRPETNGGNTIVLKTGEICHIRITLLDGGETWNCLSCRLLEGPVKLFIGNIELRLQRIISTPISNGKRWSGFVAWQKLVSSETAPSLTLKFCSPTAFSFSNRSFVLFPEPSLIWESLLRTWNLYAPQILKMSKDIVRELVARCVTVAECDLSTVTLHYSNYSQKGFIGSCTYNIREDNEYTAQIYTLAKFAQFSGIGYKTTMGMGQTYYMK